MGNNGRTVRRCRISIQRGSIMLLLPKGGIKMTIEEKIALLKYAKRELRHLLNEDKYLEVDFIADELGVNKKEVLKTIKNLVSEKGKQRREFE